MLCIQSKIGANLTISNSDHEVQFAKVIGDHVGVTKVLIEFNDYQSECFGELIFIKKKDTSQTTTKVI